MDFKAALLELIQHPGYTNRLIVTADFTSGTWNTVDTHELFTITGAVKILVLPIVTGTLTESVGGDPTICLGFATETDDILPDTVGTVLDVDMLWLANSGDYHIAGNLFTYDIVNDEDLGYEIKVGALDGGSIMFICLWTALEEGAIVEAGLGGVL